MLIMGFALMGLLGVFAACTHTPKIVNNDPNAVYACPMHPEVTGKAGDKCSKCGMDLEATAAVSTAVVSTAAPVTTPTIETPVIPAVEQSAANPLAAVYTSYFDLKDALTKDDGKAAQMASKALFDNMANVPMDKLSTDQHAVWMKYQKKLRFDAEHIKSVDKNDRQREHFVSLSKNMHEVMKVIKNDQPVYYQNCPMYDHGKGANWLSLEAKISNPYFGMAMLTCGKTVETM